MSLKKKLLKIFIILILILLILFFQKQITRIFKKSEHLQLQYENVEYVEILFNSRSGLNTLKNKTAIKSLIGYLNDLELINEENNNENNVFTVYLFGDMPSTAISFSENYLNFSDAECWDCSFTEYYIVESKFDELYNFFNELIDKYAEE